MEENLTLFSQVSLGSIEITLPIVTVNEAHCTQHWTKKHKRHKKQKGLVRLMLNPHKKILKLPCHILLTRYGPRKLDKHDNLPISLKYIVDACCEVITGDYRPGRADGDERISISYKQIISKVYAVKIKITF